MKPVPIEKWGKDHWSLLAYVETRCVDYKGILDEKHMRCNPAIHPEHDWSLDYAGGPGTGWKSEYGTRLRGYFDKNEKGRLQLPAHDDWSCLEDLQAARLVKLDGSRVQLTGAGIAVSQLLREFKIKGGQYADFVCDRDKIALGELLS